MKEFFTIMIVSLIAISLFRALIPSKEVEIHVGDNMQYETNLVEQIEQELKLLK